MVPQRIPLEEVYMRLAEELARRSTCRRRSVGAVITSADLTRVRIEALEALGLFPLKADQAIVVDAPAE